MQAKLVGQSINEGIYHEMIHTLGIPYLSELSAADAGDLLVKDVMSAPVKLVHAKESRANIVHLLESTTHNAFPVLARASRTSEVSRVT
jgi:predicted transcriptional regulator